MHIYKIITLLLNTYITFKNRDVNFINLALLLKNKLIHILI